MLKGHASFAVAIAVTAISLPVNLPAVAGEAPGAVCFIMSAGAALCWAVVSAYCGFSRVRTVAACALVGIMLAGVCAAWLFPWILDMPGVGLAAMLAASPLWGFGAVAGGASQAGALCVAVCALLLIMLACAPWRQHKKLSDVSVFGPDPWKLANQPEYPDIDRIEIRRKLKLMKNKG